MAAGYATITYKMKLTCKRLDWLMETKCLYNQVRTFYHGLLRDTPRLHELGSQAALRELEKLSLVGRCGDVPARPIPYEGVPAYFRRSAANGAIGSFQTYRKNYARWEREEKREAESGRILRKRPPQPADVFCASPVFYKGMYKDFTENAITLKLWTGSAWAWVRCRYHGRPIPKKGLKLSPLVVIHKGRAMLHIPVKEEVSDIRPVKERVAQNDPLCAVAFTNTDAFAVCSVLGVDGRMTASRFIRGGNAYMHHSKRLLERIRVNRSVLGKRFDWTGCNRRYWKRLNDLSDYWAHKVSREIVNFCISQGAKTIALMEPDFQRMAYIGRKAGKYTAIYLSLRIRRYLAYKAWKAGIAITAVKPGYIAGVCSCCGEWLGGGNRLGDSRQPKDRKWLGNRKEASVLERTYVCPKGHRGNRYLNTAKNIGRNCLNKLGKRPVSPA